jgi:hypothetical protein
LNECPATAPVSGRDVLVRGWNVLGLLDLAVAITTGFLTSPSAFQAFSFDAPNELISAFPLVMVPVFAVPLAAILHVASLIAPRCAAFIRGCGFPDLNTSAKNERSVAGRAPILLAFCFHGHERQAIFIRPFAHKRDLRPVPAAPRTDVRMTIVRLDTQSLGTEACSAKRHFVFIFLYPRSLKSLDLFCWSSSLSIARDERPSTTPMTERLVSAFATITCASPIAAARSPFASFCFCRKP